MTTNDETRTSVDRRTFLRGTAAGAAGLGVAGVASAPAAAQSGELDEWLSDVSNYDGVVDRTGKSEVTVEVGASGNGGAYAFGPAAVRVDPGTKVVWEWTGKGGSHNVVAADGSFESDLTGDAGHRFSHTFESDGVHRYACSPHEPMGMKGGVVVGGAAVSESASETSAESGRELLLVGVLGGVILAVLGLLTVSEARKRTRAREGHGGQ